MQAHIHGRTHSSSLQLTVLVWRVHCHGWHRLRPSGREGPQTAPSCQQGRHVRETLHCRRNLLLLHREHRKEGREKKRKVEERKKYKKSGEERRTKGGEWEKGRKKEEEGEEKVQRRNEGGGGYSTYSPHCRLWVPSVHSSVIYSTGMLAGFNSTYFHFPLVTTKHTLKHTQVNSMYNAHYSTDL